MGWIIAAAILLLIIALLACSVAVRFQYDKNGDITLKINYLFVTLYTIPARPKKKKAKKKRVSPKKAEKGKAVSSEETDAPSADEDKANAADAAAEPQKKAVAVKKKAKQKKKNKLTLNDIFALIRLVTDGVLPPLKRLFKRIRIYDFCLYITCGGDDAAEAALNYGKTNIAVGAVLGNLDTFFTLKPYDVEIGVDFEAEETVTECSCMIKLSLLAALAFAATAIIRVLRHLKQHPDSERAVRKVANMKK